MGMKKDKNKPLKRRHMRLNHMSNKKYREFKEQQRRRNPIVKAQLYVQKKREKATMDAQQVPHDNALLQSKLLRLKAQRRKERETQKAKEAEKLAAREAGVTL
eukprot:RCo028703